MGFRIQDVSISKTTKYMGTHLKSTTRGEESDEKYMKLALREAERGGRKGEVPVGAILVKRDQILAQDHNRCIELNDPTAHAEILVLRKAGEVLKNYRLNNTTLYVTVEPCPMCASAMIHGRIYRLVFGAPEPKFGAAGSKVQLLKDDTFNHSLKVDRGVLEKECVDTLRGFFREKREKHRLRSKAEEQGKKQNKR
jgi:tRNA(adenine34) deaminase